MGIREAWDAINRAIGDGVEREASQELLREKYPPVKGLSAETAEATGAMVDEKGNITFPGGDQ